jgi:hypothetical protein
MATLQVVDSTGKTYAARRLFINGNQVYPPNPAPQADGYAASNSYNTPSSAKDGGEGQLLLPSVS